MVFARSDLSHPMNDRATRQIGYAFALPRLVARLAGHKPRRAEFSGAEAYGLGILVFGISCIFVARALLPIVRPFALYLLVLFVLPFAIWIALLLLYYLNSLVDRPLSQTRALRRGHKHPVSALHHHVAHHRHRLLLFAR